MCRGVGSAGSGRPAVQSVAADAAGAVVAASGVSHSNGRSPPLAASLCTPVDAVQYACMHKMRPHGALRVVQAAVGLVKNDHLGRVGCRGGVRGRGGSEIAAAWANQTRCSRVPPGAAACRTRCHVSYNTMKYTMNNTMNNTFMGRVARSS